jgi:hypothetical protein
VGERVIDRIVDLGAVLLISLAAAAFMRKAAAGPALAGP